VSLKVRGKKKAADDLIISGRDLPAIWRGSIQPFVSANLTSILEFANENYSIAVRGEIVR
jgi:hypothetical protein